MHCRGPKICQKWLITVIFSSDWEQEREDSQTGGMLPCPSPVPHNLPKSAYANVHCSTYSVVFKNG